MFMIMYMSAKQVNWIRNVVNAITASRRTDAYGFAKYPERASKP